MISGRGELGAMVATPPAALMLKPMVSAPWVASASWMAALRVQKVPEVLMLQLPSPGLASGLSSILVTVKLVEAWAGGATIPATNAGTTSPAATSTVARATLALRAADLRSPSASGILAVYVMSCLLL